MFNDHDKVKEGIIAGGSAIVGGGIGYGVVAATGFTAAGIVGGGAGIGSAAGPAGAALGALAGLGCYGIYRTIKWKLSS